MKNSISLIVVNAVQILSIFVVYFFAMHFLEVDDYVGYIKASAVIAIPIMVVNYGLNESGIKDIASSEDLLMTVVSILSARLILLFLSAVFVALYLVVSSVDELVKNLVIIGFGLVLNEAIVPVWYFYGLRIYSSYARIILFQKTVHLLIVIPSILLLKSVLVIPVLNVLTSLVGTFFLWRLLPINTFAFSWVYGARKIKENVSFFLQGNVYKKSFVLLRLYVISKGNDIQTLSYDFGEKILGILKLPITIQSQINLPKYSVNLLLNKLPIIQVVYLIIYSLIVTLSIYFFGQDVVEVILDNGVEIKGVVLMSGAVLFTGVNAVIMSTYLLPRSKKTELLIASVIASVGTFLVILLFGDSMGIYIPYVLLEFLLMLVYLHYYAAKK